jgi:hypothetical protein
MTDRRPRAPVTPKGHLLNILAGIEIFFLVLVISG